MNRSLLLASWTLLSWYGLTPGPSAIAAEDLLVSGWNSRDVLRYDALDGENPSTLVSSGSGGLSHGDAMAFGRDGHLYMTSFATDEVLRFDGTSGAFDSVFVSAGSGGLDWPTDLAFAPNGDLLVVSRGTKSVLRYDGASGAFLTAFIEDDAATIGIDETGGINLADAMVYGPDGHLYLSDENERAVFKYDGLNGAFLERVVDTGEGGLLEPGAIAFSPAGDLFVTDFEGGTVLRFDGETGVFEEEFVSAGSGGLLRPSGMAFDVAGDLYVASRGTDNILRYSGVDGTFVEEFVSAGLGGLDGPSRVAFRPQRVLELYGPLPGQIDQVNEFVVWGATPSQISMFFFGLSIGRLELPGCSHLYLENPIFGGFAFADAQGEAKFPVLLPALASGFTIYVQAVEPVSCRSSEVLRTLLPDTGSAASFSIHPSGNIFNSSTYKFGCIQLTNDSTDGQRIEKVSLDLSTAILMDMVYDLDGTAGDDVGKNLSIDIEGSTGYVSHEFRGFHDNGWDIVDIYFDSFDPGETVAMSIDVDPTSIQGAPQPGPFESGSVSGLELAGATLTVHFDDQSFKVGRTFRIPGTDTGSIVSLRSAEETLPAPTMEVLGVPNVPAIVPDAAQTVRVYGRIGERVRLLRAEGGLYVEGLPGGGFDIDPFEANNIVSVSEASARVGTSGWVDIPITLTKRDDAAGLNHLMAVHENAAGLEGPPSAVIILELE